MVTQNNGEKSPYHLGILDINENEKDRRKLPKYNLEPIWRWFWVQLQKAGIAVQDVRIDFQTENQGKYTGEEQQCLIIHMDHYVPTWFWSFISRIKKENPAIKLMMCGYLPTLKAQEIKRKMPEIDQVLEGPLELVLERFIRNLDQMTGYAGLDRQVCDTSTYPDSVELRPNDIHREMYAGSPSGTIQASAGCPRVCSFCRYSAFYHQYYPKMYDQYQIHLVINEMKYLYDEYHIRHFRFSDSNFLGSGRLVYQRAKELMDAIEENNLKVTFEMHCRSDAINEEVLKCLISAGLLHVSIGIESMSDTQLQRFEKGETAQDHLNAIRLLREKNVIVQGYGILADPLVTRNELIENVTGLYQLSQDILILINERMILYDTTKYYRKYKDAILSRHYVKNTMDAVVDYSFRDEWCNAYFSLIEEASIWLYKKMREIYQGKIRRMTTAETYYFVQKATQYRLSVLVAIARMDLPDKEKIVKLKHEALEKVYEL